MGGGSITTGYKYYASVIFGLCEGAIAGIKNIWSGSTASKQAFLNNAYGLSLIKNGTGSTTVWGYLSAHHPDQALSYKNLNYLVASNMYLGEQASLPNFTFEVEGIGIDGTGYSAYGNQDVTPADVIKDVLTNGFYGAGLDPATVTNLGAYQSYCVAQGLFFSPAYTEQKGAKDILDELVKASNSEVVWSQGQIDIVPYCDQPITGNGVTYTPNMLPEADLTDDDFITTHTEGSDSPGGVTELDFGSSADDPITCTVSNFQDAFNHIQIEFADRYQDYNFNVAEAKDIADIALHGLKTKDPEQCHFICDRTVAQIVAQSKVNRALYIRRTFEFYLSWNYCLLKPMSLVTITDTKMGINQLLCRVVEIEETGNGRAPLKFKVEEAPIGTYTPAVYTPQAPSGIIQDPTTSPGNANTPVIFEPPSQLAGGLAVWLITSGGSYWGGCYVWVSTDGGSSYYQVRTIKSGCRHGVLRAQLVSGSDPDTSHTLSVNLSSSYGTIDSGTQADADSYATLCYVDGELISYETANLVGVGQYDLTYLRRGAYGTSIATHPINGLFARLDGTVFKYPYQSSQIGRTIRIKLQSFNLWGQALQDLSTVPYYSHTLTGTGLTAHTQYFSNQSIPAGGQSFTYSPAFSNSPNLQVTIYNQQSGDYYTITAASNTGFTIQVLNGGSGVARTVDISATGI